MPKTAKRKQSPHRGPSPREVEAYRRRRSLRAAVRVERDVQRLAMQLDREMQRTNDRIQRLAIVLGSRARALEAERDAEAALRG